MFKKLSLHQWLATEEEMDVKIATKFLIQLTQHGRHEGDCTGHGHPCDLCMLETILQEYKRYCDHFVEIAVNNLS